jgi:hypothetical protein
MCIDEERFGIPRKNFALALARSTEHCHRVPTRKEVGCLPRAELRALLIGWMVHSPSELVPSRGQIDVVLGILAQREDAHAMGDLSALCRNYIEGA